MVGIPEIRQIPATIGAVFELMSVVDLVMLVFAIASQC
jgi:hypothetical protein